MTRKEYYEIIADNNIIVSDTINNGLYCKYEPLKAQETNIMVAIDDIMIKEGLTLQERIKYEEEYNVRNYVRALLVL